MSACVRLEVDVAAQRLRLLSTSGAVLGDWPVSTARRGVGERSGSEQTPRGAHVVRARIGAGAPEGAVFVSRRPTGEVYTPALGAQHPQRDWVLTRILWLSGLERGRNRGGDVDTFRRFIYVHGCPDEVPLGVPLSHGCIRMRNTDLVPLFEQVPVGARVDVLG